MRDQGSKRVRTSLDDRMVARTLRRVVQRGMRADPERFVPAAGPREVKLVGLDPVRVLVVGSGLALGWGAATQEEGLTGALAHEVQERTGRGAIVVNRVGAEDRLAQTVERLGAVGATTFPIVAWCPSLLEVFRPPDRGRSRQALLEGLELLRETAPPSGVVVLCELPLPTDRGPLEEIARRLVRRWNTALHRVTAPLPGVRVAETPPFTSLDDPAAFAGDYHRRWASLLLEQTALPRLHPA